MALSDDSFDNKAFGNVSTSESFTTLIIKTTTDFFTSESLTLNSTTYGNFNSTPADPGAPGSRTTPLENKLLNIQSVLNIILLIVILLSVGASTSFSAIKKEIKRPIGVIIACCIEFILMPLIAYGLPRLIPLRENYQLGLYLVSCSPGGALSNLFALAGRGSVPLSICMTTIATFLSIGMLPLHLFIYTELTSSEGGTIAIPFENVLITLACIILPATAGILIRYKFERIAVAISRICGLIGFLLILVALGIRIFLNVDLYLSSSWEPLFIAGVMPVTGMIVGFIFTTLFRMPCYERRTVSLETGGQNFTLALTVISLSFPPSLALQEMLVMPSFYAFFSTLEVIVLVGITRTYSRFQFFGPCERGEESNDNEEISLACNVSNSEKGVTNSAFDEVDENQVSKNGAPPNYENLELDVHL